jgi:hypothetical protein
MDRPTDAKAYKTKGVELRLLRDASWMPQGRIRRGWLLVEVCLYVGVLVLFNAYPQNVGIWFLTAEQRSFVPLLTSAFEAHLPWLNAWWSLSLLLALAKFGLGRWTMTLRWLDLGLRVFAIDLAVRLLVGGPLLGLEPGLAAGQGLQWASSLHERVAELNASLRLGLGLWLTLTVVRAMQTLLRLVRVAQPGLGPKGTKN